MTILYPICPMDELMELSPEIMINISAFSLDYLQAEDRMNVIIRQLIDTSYLSFYINQIERRQTSCFDGGSIEVCPDGNIFRGDAAF